VIVGEPVNYGCDQCHAVAPGYQKLLPAGWVRSRWRCLLDSPSKPPPPDQHYCETCSAARRAAKDAANAAKEKDDAHPSEATE